MKKRYLAVATAAASILTANASWADTYPTKPITIVVPVATGGTVDMLSRIIAKGLSEDLGQPVIVENKAGAGGTIGTRHVARSAPDGYTLLAVANTFASVPEFVANAGYDPVKDFTPITQTCSIPMVLVTHPSEPARTVQAFIERARSDPEGVSIGSSGLGSTGYIAAELFSRKADVKFLNVFYKGNSQALLDVIGGQLTGMFDQVSTAGPNVKTSKVKALAVTTLTRSPLLPDVPTLDESGLKGFEDETFNAVLAPAGTPEAIVKKLHSSISKVLNEPETKRRLSSQGIEVKLSNTPAEFGEYLQDSVEKYRSIAVASPEK